MSVRVEHEVECPACKEVFDLEHDPVDPTGEVEEIVACPECEATLIVTADENGNILLEEDEESEDEEVLVDEIDSGTGDGNEAT